MTPVEQPASAASATLARTSPSAAISSARLRAGVMRGGSRASVLHLTPKRGLPGSKTVGGPIIMRTTMPKGESV